MVFITEVANKSNLGQKCQWKTNTFTAGNLGQKWPRKNKAFTVGILGQKWPGKNKNFHHWWPWPKITKIIFLKTSEIRMGSVNVWHTNNVSIPGELFKQWTLHECLYLLHLVACVRKNFGDGKKHLAKRRIHWDNWYFYSRKKPFRDRRSRYIDITTQFLR